MLHIMTKEWSQWHIMLYALVLLCNVYYIVVLFKIFCASNEYVFKQCRHIFYVHVTMHRNKFLYNKTN